MSRCASRSGQGQCEGRAGHGGLHGAGDIRWSGGLPHAPEVEVRHDPEALAAAQPVPPATGRGVVYAAGQPWRGVVTLHDDAVVVELLDVRDQVWPVAVTTDEHGPEGMTTDPGRPLEPRPGRVVLPWAQVVCVVLADD